MLHPINRRFVVFAAAAFAGTFAAACQSTDISDPTNPAQHAAPKALHDDDPSTCKSGYTITDGHTYCNPDI